MWMKLGITMKPRSGSSPTTLSRGTTMQLFWRARGRLDEAQAQAEAVLRINPNYAEAHEFLGTLLVTRGQTQAAIDHYREAVRIRPDFARANLNLGSALADAGDAAGARPYLQKSSQSTDPAIRQEAQRILQRIENRH